MTELSAASKAVLEGQRVASSYVNEIKEGAMCIRSTRRVSQEAAIRKRGGPSHPVYAGTGSDG